MKLGRQLGAIAGMAALITLGSAVNAFAIIPVGGCPNWNDFRIVRVTSQECYVLLPLVGVDSRALLVYRRGVWVEGDRVAVLLVSLPMLILLRPRTSRLGDLHAMTESLVDTENRCRGSSVQPPTSAADGPTPERPGLQRRRTTAQTRYINMLLELDDVPKLHNILASLFTWILLAGYIVFPATFNKLQKDLGKVTGSALKTNALKTVRNVPLLYVAAFACGIGVLGCFCLWWKHRSNYVWVINRLFLPSLMNSLAGLISTLVSVYTAQAGRSSFRFFG